MRASRIVVRDGAILLTRRGNLNFADQVKRPSPHTAPEKRGLWAFPYPYFDDFYAWHKWDEVLPARLCYDAIAGLVFGDEATAEALWAERDGWIEAHRDTMPLRNFWWQGDLWAHFSPTGDILGNNSWTLLTLDEFERFIRRYEPDGRPDDYAEIFLSPSRGRIVGQGGRGMELPKR